MENFVKIVQIIIWPITAIILACIFKRSLSDLISNIVTIKYKDFEAKFAKKVEDLRKKAKDLPCSLNVAVSDSISLSDSINAKKEVSIEKILTSEGMELYANLAKIDPKSAVMESWRKLALTIQEKAKKLGVRHNIREAIEMLTKKGLIDPGEKEMVNELRILRNEIEYAPNYKLTFLDAIKYAELAGRLTCYIQDRSCKE